jgi:hypothetical protein
MFSFKILFFIFFSSLAWADYSPLTTCAGPYACVLSNYLGIQFPDGTKQSTAASSGGGIDGVGTIDTENTPSADGAVISGADIIMQSASSTVPGLVNNSAQTFSGIKTFSSSVITGAGVAATNSVLILNNGHTKSTQTTPPTATPNANAGTAATCTVTHATDSDGIINLTTTATLPALGAQCAITFNKTFNAAPICIFSPNNANAGQLSVSSGIYLTTSTTLLTVNFAVSDATGHSYQWMYHCEETQ